MKTIRFLLVACLCSAHVLAYDFTPGDSLLRPLVGARVNLIPYDAIMAPVPSAGVLLGLEGDYMIDGQWSIGGAFRPLFAPGFIYVGAAPQAKYHITQTDTPFVPFVQLGFEVGVQFPLTSSPVSVMFGGRPSFGIDYFVMHNFALGLEFALFFADMVTLGNNEFNLAIDAILGLTWRL